MTPRPPLSDLIGTLALVVVGSLLMLLVQIMYTPAPAIVAAVPR